jgi:hypothetical protein
MMLLSVQARTGGNAMSSFWTAIAVALLLAMGANVILGAIQTPAETAFATQGVRL